MENFLTVTDKIGKKHPKIFLFANFANKEIWKNRRLFVGQIIKIHNFYDAKRKIFNLFLLKHKFVLKSIEKQEICIVQQTETAKSKDLPVEFHPRIRIMKHVRTKHLTKSNKEHILREENKNEEESSSKLINSSYGSNDDRWMRI